MMTNVMVKTYLNQKIMKNSNLIQSIKNSVCPTANVTRRPIFSESRIFRSFRIVDWTHDMIIVKWHLFIWHERKLCALTSAPPVQSTQMGQWLSTLFHANCSAAQVYVLHPGQFIFALSSRRRSFLQVLQSTERQERYFEKFFVYLMMTNVMMKTCFNQKSIKISNLIQAMKNSVCPKAKVMRRPNFSESRISPNIFRSFRIVDSTHDMIIVKWHLLNFSKAEFVRIFTECSEVWIDVDWTHDMIIVKRHLFIWHERKLCALTNAPPVQSTQTGQWLSTLFQANCSAAQVYVLHPIGNSSSLQDAGDDHSWRYYNSLSAKKDIFKNFLCLWWWQMLRRKHVFTKKLQKFRIWFRQ